MIKETSLFMHSLSREHIEFLAEKKLLGTINPEEQELLNQWLNQDMREHTIRNLNASDEQALRERLLKRIKEDAGIAEYSSTNNKRLLHHYRWVAAAAILFLIAGSLSYFLFFNKAAAPVIVANNNNKIIQNVAPGHSGAILTLANGRKVVLDSVSNGTIALQGSRSLIKKQGQLIYKNATDTNKGNNEPLKKKMTYNTLATPRGREFQIVLPDGSKVWLNAASSITYPTAFSGKERKVTITGEVYFEIAKDSRHPFIVTVGNAEVKVLGTHFDVMAYPDEEKVQTTLLEGAVRVVKGQEHVILSPGQQARFSKRSDQIQVLKPMNVSRTIAWTEGELSMNNLEVEAIMRKVSRWYDVDVEFAGPVPQGRFWGIINRDVNLQDMLKVLRLNGINARLKNHKVVVSNH